MYRRIERLLLNVSHLSQKKDEGDKIIKDFNKKVSSIKRNQRKIEKMVTQGEITLDIIKAMGGT